MINNDEPQFGKASNRRTRAQALADLHQFDVTSSAKDAGIRFPTFITRAVYDNYVAVPEGGAEQDAILKLWNLMALTRAAIQQCQGQVGRVEVQLCVRNDNAVAGLVRFVVTVGPLDFDDASPAITIAMSDED